MTAARDSPSHNSPPHGSGTPELTAEPTARTPPAPAELDWVRLHPLTPLLRGGRFAVAALVVIGQQGLRESGVPGRYAVAGFLAAVLAAVLLGWVSWRAMRYRVTDTELQVESGVVTTRSRRVPLAQVQAIDVVRPFYARVLGLAELRLEVVGGGDSEAPLAFLSEDEALQLRSRLLDRVGRASTDSAPAPAPALPERLLVAVPTGTLIRSSLLGPPLVLLGLLPVVAVVGAVLGARAVAGMLVAVVPAVLGVASVTVRRLLVEYGFTVSESADGLRLRSGLLDTRSQTIPAGRIQTVRVLEPLLWKPFGWVRVEVDVAGYGPGQGQSVTGTLLPVCPAPFASQLVSRVLGAELPPVDRPAPRAARWRAPLSYRRLGLGLDSRHLVATSGVLTTTTDVVPIDKLQGVRVTTGPWQRRLGLASLHVDSAGRRLSGALARHRRQDEAESLLLQVAALARQAQRSRA